MPYAMVATHVGSPDVLHEIELTVANPTGSGVLIRQTAIGVNFIDVYYRSGLYPWPQEKNLVLGSEAVGVVESVGPEVRQFSVGDRVAYTVRNGAYVSHRIVDEAHLVSVPDGVDDNVAAASLLKGLTVHYLLHDSYNVQRGDVVLFHAAAGGVGTIAGQWLKALGAAAIGTAGGRAKCEFAKSHGFTHVINYLEDDFVAAVLDLTDGAGVDVVYDSVGKDTYPGSFQCLKTFGTMVNFGQSSGPALDFKLSDLAVGSFSVSRPILFHYTSNGEWLRTAAADLFNLIQQREIVISVNDEFHLRDVKEAHRLLESRKSTGSLVLRV